MRAGVLPDPPEVAAALERARRGDAVAFGELVDRYREAVFRAALAAIGSPTDAEEAAQEAFVAAYRRLDRFRGESSFKTWLLAIAWRKALDRRRSPRREFVPLDTGDPDGHSAMEPASNNPGPDALLAGAETRRALRAFIAALPPKLRNALLLATSGQYSYDEIGVMLEIPVGTVKSRVSDARRVLREKLQRLGY
jgi:RNA polymerase sigma-70 factor (ECF subfamily)